MARPLRPLVDDGIYHVYNRGNALQSIFDIDEQRTEFLRTFRRVRDLCDWTCLSYCLMGNHYHLVVRTPVPNLAEGMRQLNSSYAQAFNRRRGVPGPVFQGRYGSKLVQRDDHFLTTLKYVALNPVEAGLCRRPEAWPWSAHSALLGLTSSDVVDVKETLALIEPDPASAISTYRRFVDAETAPSAPHAHGGIVVGDASFAAAAIARASMQSREMPLRQRLAGRPGLSELFAGDRDAGLLSAYFTYGYSQREIGNHLGRHYSTISRLLRAAEEAKCGNERLDP
jgi:REP element-mobilizing transposase RayT